MRQAMKVSQINDDKSLSSRTSLIALSAHSNPKTVYFILFSHCTGSVLASFQKLFRSVTLEAFPV